MCIIKILFFFYLWFFSYMFIGLIDKGGGFTFVVPGIDKFVWTIKANCIYFGSMKLKWVFGWTRA